MTATQKMKDKIFVLLELRNPKQISESPNKRNVRYTVKNWTSLCLLWKLPLSGQQIKIERKGFHKVDHLLPNCETL